MKFKRWTKKEVDILREKYPDMNTRDLSKILKRRVACIQQKAFSLNIRKSEAYMIEDRKRLADNGKKHRYNKGHTPHNTGQKMPAHVYEKVSKTFFKNGHKPHNTKYDGYIIVNSDGYKMIRESDNHYVLLHRKVWTDKYGPVPPQHCITFKDKNPLNCDIDNLELITRAENVKRNQLHKYPAELQQLIKLKNTLKKKINEKQN